MMETGRKEGDVGPDLSMVHTPLSEIEKGKYRQILEGLRRESDRILRSMRSAGVRIQARRDPFGKTILDLDEASEKLAELRAKLQEGASSPD